MALSAQVVAVVTATDGVTVPPHWSVNFAVRDADAIAEHAGALGGTVVMAPIDTPGFRNAVIADPQGGAPGGVSQGHRPANGTSRY